MNMQAVKAAREEVEETPAKLKLVDISNEEEEVVQNEQTRL